MTAYRSLALRAAAVAGTAALVVSGAQVAHAQSSAGNLDSGSLKAYGQSPDSGSLLQPVNALGTGSVDTTNSSLGEPTTGSLSNVVGTAQGSFNVSSPAPGTGSVDTTNSSLGEPTTGSLSGIYAPLAGSLGTDEGITTILGSLGGGTGTPGTGSTGGTLPTGSLEGVPGLGSVGDIIVNVGSGEGSTSMLLPIVLVGGSVAAGIAAAPMIQQALAGAKLPVLPGSAAVTPPPPPAVGPSTPNGRGGEPGATDAQGGATATVSTVAHITAGSLGAWDVELPAGVQLPKIQGLIA